MHSGRKEATSQKKGYGTRDGKCGTFKNEQKVGVLKYKEQKRCQVQSSYTEEASDTFPKLILSNDWLKYKH